MEGKKNHSQFTPIQKVITMKSNPVCMISSDGCFVFGNDSDVMDLNKCVSFFPPYWARFLFTYCPESLPLSEFLFLTSWSLLTLLSAVACLYFHHLHRSVLVSINSRVVIVFQTLNVDFNLRILGFYESEINQMGNIAVTMLA